MGRGPESRGRFHSTIEGTNVRNITRTDGNTILVKAAVKASAGNIYWGTCIVGFLM